MAREVVHIPARRELTNRAAVKNKKVRLAAYCRVSTKNEDQLLSFENQKAFFEDYVVRHPQYELVGIYPDKGITGTNTKHREEFLRMIEDCKAGKIDMIVTKSISRFARNTEDFLRYARMLKEMGIGILFDKEGLNTLDGTTELLFTILSSLAQDESRSISENSQWGIRFLFSSEGRLHLNAKRFLGYDKDMNGKLVINPEQAEIVKRIYREFMDGNGPGVIASRLRAEGIPGVMGESRWAASTIKGILRNEKYNGDALLQKTYTVDFLSKKMAKNEGQVEQTWVKDDHEAIIPKGYWNVVQLELDRREQFLQDYGLRTNGRYTDEQPFSTKVFCGDCNRLYRRRTLPRLNTSYSIVWMCTSYYEKKGVPGCGNFKLREKDLHRAFMEALNAVLTDKETYMPIWQKAIADPDSDPLRAFRSKQMMELAEHAPYTAFEAALVNKTLQRCEVNCNRAIDFFFLDGSSKQVQI